MKIKKSLFIIIFSLIITVFYFLPGMGNWFNFLYGGFGDQVSFIWLGWWFKNFRSFSSASLYFSPIYGAPFGLDTRLNFFNEPILRNPLIFSLFSPVFVFNFLIFLSFPLSLISMYLLLKRVVKTGSIALAFASLFAFSPYHFLQARNHLVLSQIFLVPLFFIFLTNFFRNPSLRNAFFVSLGLTFFFLIANYYGYLSLVVFLVWFALEITKTRRLLKSGVFLMVSVAVLFFIVSSPFLHAFRGKDGLSTNKDEILDNFILFSSRPWYFVIPPVQHPIFGERAQHLHDFIREAKPYFLTDDFFDIEHSGLFLGFLNMFFATYALFYAIRKRKELSSKGIFTFAFIALALIVISGPPFLTLAEHKIYLPAYILMKFFPMFRVLSRLGIFILVCVLVLAAFGFKFLVFERIKNERFRYLFLAIFTILALFEFYIPPEWVKIPPPPPEYTWLAKRSDYFIIMEYPYDYAGGSIFWQRYYRKGLLNPRDFQNAQFNAKEFTENFIQSEENIDKIEKLGVKYIVYHKDDNENFFFKSSKLKKIKTFADGVSLFEVSGGQ